MFCLQLKCVKDHAEYLKIFLCALRCCCCWLKRWLYREFFFNAKIERAYKGENIYNFLGDDQTCARKEETSMLAKKKLEIYFLQELLVRRLFSFERWFLNFKQLVAGDGEIWLEIFRFEGKRDEWIWIKFQLIKGEEIKFMIFGVTDVKGVSFIRKIW